MGISSQRADDDPDDNNNLAIVSKTLLGSNGLSGVVQPKKVSESQCVDEAVGCSSFPKYIRIRKLSAVVIGCAESCLANFLTLDTLGTWTVGLMDDR